MFPVFRRSSVLNSLAFCWLALLLPLAASCGSPGASPSPSPAPVPSPSPSASCVSAGNDLDCHVSVNGTSREFLLHVPANFQANSSALVVVLHGAGQDGAGIASASQMSVKADDIGFAVAYPYSLVSPQQGALWHNYFDDPIWAPQGVPDDVGFMRTLVSAVEAKVHPNPKKIYFAGFSNGGLFAHRVAIEMPDVVAAAGVVEGSLFLEFNGGTLQGIPPAKASVSLEILHGDADATINYCAQQEVASQETTFNYWRQTPANACTRLDSSLPLCDAQGNITALSEKDATGCKGGAEVKFYKLIGGQHAWSSSAMDVPGQSPYNPAFNSTTGVTTNDLLWNFFAAHPKP